MRLLPLLASLLFPTLLSAAEWIPLFDGTTTKGWTPRSPVTRFEAKDDVLELDSAVNTWVTTDLQLSDFEAEIEVLLPPDAAQSHFNSGLAYRCSGAKGKPVGYQCEIDLEKPAGIYGIGLGGWLYPGKDTGQQYAQRSKGLFKPADWNHFRVVAQGSQVRTYLNGTLVAEIHEDRQLSGYFGIQHHGKGGTVKFRNIRVRPLHPNILWITIEDLSPLLGCYGDPAATTPHLDALAKESVRYTRAFATAPVCSPSRSCLITGLHTVTLGTHQMRSEFPMPEGVRAFPSYLREAGYFTTNNVKTDYNTSDAPRLTTEAWDDSSATAHWRHAKRRDGQPFFAVFNDMTTHQSRTTVWPHEVFVREVQSQLSPSEIHNPATLPLPPYYPDTPVVRQEWARLYDCVTVMDKNTGRLLAQLEEDGLAEDTIVVFYSDHGTGMPRGKRLLQDSGMRIALLIRFPEKYQHLAPSAPGTTCGELVNFVDFPRTTLDLAGLPVPDHMQGRTFLGPRATKAPDYLYGSRDRVDEMFEMSRSVRSPRHLYLRHYHPYLSYNQPSVFPDLGAIRREITKAANEHLESLTPAQRDYAGPHKPVECFYDCATDPDNLHNLVGTTMTADQQAALDAHRKAFQSERLRLLDPAPVPEGEMWNWIRAEGKPLHDILAGKTSHRPDLPNIWKAADTVGTGTTDQALALLKSTDPSERYWGIIALRQAGYPDLAKVADHLLDTSPDVRIETAAWLARHESHRPAALAALIADLGDRDWWNALRACRAIELLGKDAAGALPAMRKLYAANRDEPGDGPFYLAFSSGAFLDQFGEPTKPWDFAPGAGAFTPEPDKKQDRDRARIGK